MPTAVYSGGSHFKRGQEDGATGGELRLARVSEDFVQPFFFSAHLFRQCNIFYLFPKVRTFPNQATTMHSPRGLPCLMTRARCHQAVKLWPTGLASCMACSGMRRRIATSIIAPSIGRLRKMNGPLRSLICIRGRGRLNVICKLQGKGTGATTPQNSTSTQAGTFTLAIYSPCCQGSDPSYPSHNLVAAASLNMDGEWNRLH